MFEKIKSLFKKQETFSCIVWNGKVIRYLDLTQKQIDKMSKEGLTITKKEEC